MRTKRWILAAGLLPLLGLTLGCGELTIRTWATVVEEESTGVVTLDGIPGFPPLPVERLQGGFLTRVAVRTDQLVQGLHGTIELEDVRMAGSITFLGKLCTWNDPQGYSGGTLHVDLITQESVTDIFLDALATTEMSESQGLAPVDFEQPIDFDLGSAMDPALFLDAVNAGSADGMFDTRTVLSSSTTMAGVDATFEVDVAVTNGARPPSFDADQLAFCDPFFAQQERDLYYGVNPKSSYLIQERNHVPKEPLVLDLAELGALPGDTLHLATVGTYDWLTFLKDGPYTKLGGVFSSSGTVLPAVGNLHRIPGAIDVWPELKTWPTKLCGWLGCLPLVGGNDIPQDFRIDPARDIKVPAGATHLVVAPIDDWKTWNDNSGLGFGITVGVTPGS